MPLDPVLARGLTPISAPQAPDPANQFAKIIQMENLRSQMETNALARQKNQMEMEDRNALRAALASPDPATALMRLPGGAGEIESRTKLDTARMERLQKVLSVSSELLARASDQQSYDAARQAVESMAPNTTRSWPAQFSPEAVQTLMRDAPTIRKLNEPTDFERKLRAAGIPLNSPEAQALARRQLDKDVYIAPTEASLLPSDVRTAQWYASATPEQQAAFDRANGKGGGNKVAHVLTDNAGNVRFFTDTGAEVTPTSPTGAPVAPKGKPSATYEKTAALRQQLTADIDRTIPELENITKDGGLIDQSTGSGIGRAVDWAARGAGVATPGDIAISRLQPIADMVLKMVPRFEGPQSDKDTQSYKEAAGQLADSSLPTEIRKAAGKEILRIMKARKGQFVSTAMEAEGMAAPGAADDDLSKAEALLSKYPGK